MLILRHTRLSLCIGAGSVAVASISCMDEAERQCSLLVEMGRAGQLSLGRYENSRLDLEVRFPDYLDTNDPRLPQSVASVHERGLNEMVPTGLLFTASDANNRVLVRGVVQVEFAGDVSETVDEFIDDIASVSEGMYSRIGWVVKHKRFGRGGSKSRMVIHEMWLHDDQGAVAAVHKIYVVKRSWYFITVEVIAPYAQYLRIDPIVFSSLHG